MQLGNGPNQPPWHPVVVRTSTGPAALRGAAALWIVAGVFYLMTEFVVAQQVPGYSYAADYISDLGRPLRSPMAGWMNGAFIAQGVAFALAGVLVVTALRAGRAAVVFVGLALLYGAGSVIVGVYPSGGAAAHVHVAGATAAIVAGNLAVLTAGVGLLRRRRFRALGSASVALGAAGLICAGVLLSGSVFGAPVFGDGDWERAAIYSIIGWQLLAAVAVLVRRQQCAADWGREPTARP